MADALKDVTVLSRGGLFTNEDALALAGSNPGAAVRMLNMEISQFGGYRRISGYADYDSSYGTVAGSGNIIGLWILEGVPYAVRRNLKDNTGSLGTNPFVVTSGSPTITVTHIKTSAEYLPSSMMIFVNVYSKYSIILSTLKNRLGATLDNCGVSALKRS